MRHSDYVERMESGLAAGAAGLPRALRENASGYVRSSQRPDGGFAGLRGGSDLYYTAFGLRLASLAGVRDESFWDRARAFIEKSVESRRPLSTSDHHSLAVSLRLVFSADLVRRAAEAFASHLAAARPEPGGVSELPGGDASVCSTYLAILACGCLGIEASESMRPRELLAACRSGCGWSDHVGGPAATNSTAAAIGILSALGESPEEVRAGARWLLSMQTPGGGFASHDAARSPDLVSTFAAVVALSGSGWLAAARLGDVARFGKDLAGKLGGWGAVTGGPPDVEYSYYALATLAALAAHAALRMEGGRIEVAHGS